MCRLRIELSRLTSTRCPASGLIPRVERGQHAIDDVEAGGEIGDADGNPLRRLVGVAIEVADTGHGLHQEILPGARDIGPASDPSRSWRSR